MFSRFLASGKFSSAADRRKVLAKPSLYASTLLVKRLKAQAAVGQTISVKIIKARESLLSCHQCPAISRLGSRHQTMSKDAIADTATLAFGDEDKATQIGASCTTSRVFHKAIFRTAEYCLRGFYRGGFEECR